MCFAPQCLALFQHMNFQKGVGREVLLAFWLPNALRATAARNFSYLISPDGSARRFTKPTFRPSGATRHRKNTACRSFSTFSRPSSSFYWLSLSLLWLLLFLLSQPFSGCSHHCCCICPFCWKLDFWTSFDNCIYTIRSTAPGGGGSSKDRTW